MRIKTLVDATTAIRKIAEQDLSMPTLYRVRRLLDKVEKHLTFYNEERAKIISDCGDVKNNEFIPREDKTEELNRRFTDLLAVEIDEEIKPVKIPWTEELRISYNDLVCLDGLIEIEEQED